MRARFRRAVETAAAGITVLRPPELLKGYPDALANLQDDSAPAGRRQLVGRVSTTAHTCPSGPNLCPEMLCKGPGTTAALTIHPSQSHFRVVSERGLEPPRPIKGTSTSS